MTVGMFAYAGTKIMKSSTVHMKYYENDYKSS
jgi:hypothetical protein